MPCPSTRTTIGWREALIAAFSAAGVRPVGFGTVWTRGRPRATSSAAISSVRSVDGPRAITTSISPAYSCARIAWTDSAQMPLLVEDGHDHRDGGELHVGLGVHRASASRYRERGTPTRAAGCAAPGRRSYGPTVLTIPRPGRRRGGVPRAHAAPVPRPARPPRRPQRRPTRRAARGARPPARRTKPRWAMRRGDDAVRAWCSAPAGIGHAVVTSLDAGIARVDPFKDMKNRPQAGHGHERPAGRHRRPRQDQPRQERQKYRLGGAPCHCTDTIMIVHISADRERASVVSLPRDSYAETPAHTDRPPASSTRATPSSSTRRTRRAGRT